jgi:hypothetical protein
LPYNVLLLPLLGGYFFLTYWNFTKFTTKRHSGHRLIFHAAFAGLLFLTVAFLLVGVVRWQRPDWTVWWRGVVPFPYLATSLIACFIGLTLWWPLNRFINPETTAAERAIEESNDFLEMLLARAGRETKLVSVTLKNRKVYVGLVTRTLDPMYDRKYIQLLPIKSGYRDSNTHELTLVVDYADVYAKIIRQEVKVAGGIRDFEIVIPVSEIQSVNLFDAEAYALFNPS